MSVMDKFLSSIKFGDDDMDDDDFDGYDDDEDEIEEVPRKRASVKAENDFVDEKPKSKPISKVMPLKQVRKTGANGMYLFFWL